MKIEMVPRENDKFDFALKDYMLDDQDDYPTELLYDSFCKQRLALFMKTGCRKSILGDYIYVHAKDLKDTLNKYDLKTNRHLVYLVRTVEQHLKNKTCNGEECVGFPLPDRWWFEFPQLLILMTDQKGG